MTVHKVLVPELYFVQACTAIANSMPIWTQPNVSDTHHVTPIWGGGFCECNTLLVRYTLRHAHALLYPPSQPSTATMLCCLLLRNAQVLRDTCLGAYAFAICCHLRLPTLCSRAPHTQRSSIYSATGVIGPESKDSPIDIPFCTVAPYLDIVEEPFLAPRCLT